MEKSFDAVDFDRDSDEELGLGVPCLSEIGTAEQALSSTIGPAIADIDEESAEGKTREIAMFPR